jgi:hypothetical protein
MMQSHNRISLVRAMLIEYNSKQIAFTSNRYQSTSTHLIAYSTGRPKRQPFISQTSSVTEAPSDEVEAEQEGDEDVEPARVTQ